MSSRPALAGVEVVIAMMAETLSSYHSYHYVSEEQPLLTL
jgi:hypothetical protein